MMPPGPYTIHKVSGVAYMVCTLDRKNLYWAKRLSLGIHVMSVEAIVMTL